MKDLNSIKEEIKSILGNFNPEKSTYKILNDIVNNDYEVNHIIDLFSKICGINKYPEDLKTKFSLIVSSLKEIAKIEEKERQQELIKKEIKEKEEKEKEKLRIKQEENTRELKDIIENIEKASLKRKNKKIVVEDTEEQKNLNKDLEKIDNEKYEDVEDYGNKIFVLFSKKMSFVLMGLIFISVILLILVFLFY